MSPEEFSSAVQGCTHFLRDHYPRSARQRLLDIAESPYCELKPDQYGNGGFIAEFESGIAALLGKKAALFMPSGTMAQQIALRIWADRSGNSTVAFHPMCHLHTHEHMAYRELHRLEAVLLGEADRLFTYTDLNEVEKSVGTVLIELPQRDLGGELPTWDELKAITSLAKAKDSKLHLDGARLWETGPFYQKSYSEIASDFDSVYVSFYKVLFGLPGAALAGPSDFIEEARVWMRRHGGNLHTMYPNAISAKLGLEKRLSCIPAYVEKAIEIANILNRLEGVSVRPKVPQTNMMHITFEAPKEKIMDAVGEIARSEKCLLFGGVSENGTGCKLELWVGDAGLDVPKDQISRMFSRLLELANG